VADWVKSVADAVKTRGVARRDNGRMKILDCLVALALSISSSLLVAGAALAQPAATAPESYRRAVELNLLFAFVGIFDMKLLVPVLRPGERDLRGELVVGAYSDYSWGPLSRPADEYGKVLLLAGRIGYRQHLVHGLHAEASAYLGWRHEEKNVHDGSTVDGFVGRLWLYGGWQRDLSPRFYVNVRGGLGIHLFRTDHLGHKEKELVPAGDVGLGVRF
jgi:hypothetical protein